MKKLHRCVRVGSGSIVFKNDVLNKECNRRGRLFPFYPEVAFCRT